MVAAIRPQNVNQLLQHGNGKGFGDELQARQPKMTLTAAGIRKTTTRRIAILR
jgi:hypothetical protein